MISGADLVLVMSQRHVRELHRRFGALGDKVHILPEYTGLADGDSGIPDPYGLPISSYRACARQLFECIDMLVKHLRKDIA